jgi:hypothetical protein
MALCPVRDFLALCSPCCEVLPHNPCLPDCVDSGVVMGKLLTIFAVLEFLCCHTVLMSSFSLPGPCFLWDPWGSRETWANFYDLSVQAMLLSTVYKSLNFLKSRTLSDHWKFGFISTCGWLLSGGDTFCPSDLTVNCPQFVSRHCLELNAD